MDNNYTQPLDDSWKNSTQPPRNNQYPPQGYGQHGYGYNQQGYGQHGYGYDAQGFDPQGYDMDGYDRQGYDRQGYDRNGYDRNGYDRYGNPYNPYAQQNQYKQYNQYQKPNENYGIEPEPHLVKAIFAIILCWPFGIPAMINACRVRGLANTDTDAAFEASHSANKWGNIGIIVGIIINVLYVIFIGCKQQHGYDSLLDNIII